MALPSLKCSVCGRRCWALQLTVDRREVCGLCVDAITGKAIEVTGKPGAYDRG